MFPVCAFSGFSSSWLEHGSARNNSILKVNSLSIFFSFFEIGSCYAGQAGLELANLLPQPPAPLRLHTWATMHDPTPPGKASKHFWTSSGGRGDKGEWGEFNYDIRTFVNVTIYPQYNNPK
jgi:hypothetical protein